MEENNVGVATDPAELDEDLGFVSEEDMQERLSAKEQQERQEQQKEVVPKINRKRIVASNAGDFFSQYDYLRALGYTRPDSFVTQFISGSRISYWSVEVELNPASLTLEDLETMNWGALKALGAELEVSSKNKKGLMYAICQKLGISQQVV